MMSDLSGHLRMEIRDIYLWHTLSLHWFWLSNQGSGSKTRSQSSALGLLRTAATLPGVAPQLTWQPALGPYSAIPQTCDSCALLEKRANDTENNFQCRVLP